MRSDFQHPQVEDWFNRRTLLGADLDPAALAALKRDQRMLVSVCLPALNEKSTIGAICRSIKQALVEDIGLVDHLIVMDSGSSDETANLARSAGADVVVASEVLAQMGTATGKGEALWKSLAVTDGDIVVWLDSDIRNFDPRFVTRLVAPLLVDESLAMTKGFYERPLESPSGLRPTGGGRVTELVVRPLLQLLYPLLAGVIQPLSGEYAIRREIALQIPFFTGYAVDVGLLIDLVQRRGLDALAQVDLGRRVHRNRDTLELGQMAHEIMRAVLTRLDDNGTIEFRRDLPSSFMQFVGSDGGTATSFSVAETMQRPAMATLRARTVTGVL